MSKETENLITPIRNYSSACWAIELVPTGITDASRTPIVLPVMVTSKVDDKVKPFGFQYWHQALVDIPGSRRLFNNNADDLIDLESDSTNGWFVSARLVAKCASSLFGLPSTYADVLAGIDHGLAHSREIAGYRELDEDPVVFEFDVRTPTTVFSRFGGKGEREAWCAIKSSFVKTVVLHNGKYDSDVWFPIGMARHVVVQCMSSKWMQACAPLKRSEVLSWLPNARIKEKRGKPSAVIALLLTQLRPDHVVNQSLPDITKYVNRFFTDFCLHRVQPNDEKDALEAAHKVTGLRSLAHVVPAPADDTSTDASSSEEEEDEPPVKPAQKAPRVTHQERQQLSRDVAKFDASGVEAVLKIVQKYTPRAAEECPDDEIEFDFDKMSVDCIRQLQALVVAKKRESEPEPVVESKSVEPVVEPKSVEPEPMQVQPAVIEESKVPEPMETDEKSDLDDDEDDDDVPDRTLPMRPLTPDTVTCEWSTGYSPFEGGMSDEEIKAQYGVTVPPSSPTFSAMSSASTPMDIVPPTSKHALDEEDNASVASSTTNKRARRFLTEVERLKTGFEQPNPMRFSKRLLRSTK